MNLVAVDDGLAILPRGHQRRKPADAPVALHQNVPKMTRPHLPLLGGGMPAHRRSAVVGAAGLVNEPKAAVYLGRRQAARLHEAQGVRLVLVGMHPFRVSK